MGKNCHESLCGLLPVKEEDNKKQQDMRSKFTDDAAATVGLGGCKAWARERFL